MPSFNSQHQNDRGIRWRGIAATAMVELLVLFVFAFAVVRYVEWSSDANLAEFMSGQSLPSAKDSFSAVARVGTAFRAEPRQRGLSESGRGLILPMTATGRVTEQPPSAAPSTTILRVRIFADPQTRQYRSATVGRWQGRTREAALRGLELGVSGIRENPAVGRAQ